MANKTNLSSWGNLRNYLKTNVDPNKDWDSEEIKDYNHLLGAQAAGKVSGDKFTEGRNLFQQYLADAQATDVYQQAQAKAENDARRETAYGNYLSTRLGSYLREIQGNAGIAGYGGLTQGQAIAVKNDQENALRAIQDNKRTALQGALDTYQGALASHSQTAIDQATEIDAAREAKNEDKKLAVQEYVQQYLDKTDTDGNGMYSKETATKVEDYIANSGLSAEDQEEVKQTVELVNGDAMPHYTTDDTGAAVEEKTEVQKANAEKQKKEKIYNIENSWSQSEIKSTKAADAKSHAIGEISDEDWADLQASYAKAEKKLYQSKNSSGNIYKSGTCTIKFPKGSNGILKNDDTTVTFGYQTVNLSDLPNGIGNDLTRGQAFLYNGKVWVADPKDGVANNVIDYAGTGAYERLKQVLEGTYYDFK